MSETTNNMQLFLTEDIKNTEYSNLDDIMNEFNNDFDNDSYDYTNNYLYANYDELTIKDLIKICNFYQLDKGTKGFKKSDYINLIIAFESSEENYDYVEKRQRFWTYMIELKNDPVMRKYILWD